MFYGIPIFNIVLILIHMPFLLGFYKRLDISYGVVINVLGQVNYK